MSSKLKLEVPATDLSEIDATRFHKPCR